MNIRRYPDWLVPRISTTVLDYKQVRGVLGGQARARNLSKKELREIAMLGVMARRAQTTPKQRHDHAKVAGAIGAHVRWANHQKKVKKPRLTAEQISAINRANGAKGNAVRWGTRAAA